MNFYQTRTKSRSNRCSGSFLWTPQLLFLFIWCYPALSVVQSICRSFPPSFSHIKFSLFAFLNHKIIWWKPLPNPTSLSDRGEGIATIFSLFQAANSLSDSSDSSLSNRTLQHFLSPYSITSFFLPNNSVSSSVSTQTIHFPPSISSLLPPTQSVDSQLNSLCSERSNPGFGNSMTSIFPPNYSYSSSIESTQYHDQFGSNKSKLSHEFKDVVTCRTESHFQEPNINRWRSFKFHISNEERIFQKQVEAELRQAQERWTYAIYW